MSDIENFNEGPSLEDWSAQGFKEGMGKQFAMEIQEIAPLKLFARTLPYWSVVHDTAVSITISSDPEMRGVGIQMSFDKKSLPVSAATDLTEQLMETSRLMELESLIEKMKGLGLSPDIINPVVDEAEKISKDIHYRLKSQGFAS